MKKTVYFFIILSVYSCATRGLYNQIRTDEKDKTECLYGYVNLEGFQKEPFKSWYDLEYINYQADMSTLEQIQKESINEAEICVVMGSWCSDSQREVPHFIKILESIGYDTGNLTIICVDRKKLAKKTNVVELKIEKIPTFIFSRNRIEIGRIIETPNESLEKDMLKILGGS